ncbi:NAD(P)H-quinone oxidoreductase [Aquabacter sp. CN5-332]|uniref:NAD(P)H-quinone oxidoreductase n=1 Tax=Aquabacter sp. CN5-332 TaxID=3156608 RepID=UPI0032B51BA7
MRAIEIERPGGPEVLRMTDMPRPRAKAGEVVIRVFAAGVNRPDIQQRRGLYPPPPDASPLPGLDVAGLIEEVGEGVSSVKAGDSVCALVNGGGYAEFCSVPAVQCMPVPSGLTFAEAASLPEVFFTAWNNIIWLGRLARREAILIQGGTSGVGLAGIQIARQLRDATVFATAGTAQKRQVCLEVGAHYAIDYRGDWESEVRSATGGEGVDVVLDAQAGDYTQKQLDLLKSDGRLVLIASHLGESAEVNVRAIVRRRLTLTGSTLRPRPASYKGAIASELVQHVWPLIEAGRIVTRIHAVFPWEQVRDAHELLDRNAQIGKVVLLVDPQRAQSLPERVRC